MGKKMKNTENSFGLQNINGKISADGGKTFLPKYQEMKSHTFETLVFDIELFNGQDLTESEINDLKEILS